MATLTHTPIRGRAGRERKAVDPSKASRTRAEMRDGGAADGVVG